MVEVDPTAKLIGADGPVPLIDTFEGRAQLFSGVGSSSEQPPPCGTYPRPSRRSAREAQPSTTKPSPSQLTSGEASAARP